MKDRQQPTFRPGAPHDNLPPAISHTGSADDAPLDDRAALERALDEFRSIFENATDGIFQTTADGHYIKCNPALARIYGYGSPQELQQNVRDIQRQLYVEEDSRQRFVDAMREYGCVHGFEARVYRKDRSIIWISETARAVRDAAGKLLYYEGFVSDITARKSAEDQLLRDALHDALTGLPNRALFLDRLERSISRVARDPGHHFAALFVDLDRFKVINDSLGHQAGDQLLLGCAQRLVGCVRPSDTVARLGGDEFTVLLEDPRVPFDAIGVAERILAAFRQPFRLDGHEIFISASIGIALSSGGYTRPQDVLRDADIAMYRAKALGKSRYQLFDASMHSRALKLLQIENDLRRAIDRNEFELHYQPILQTGSRRIKGFEALVRWRHPQRGLISPADFVPVAEETGLIVPMGRWVLAQACNQAAEWHRMFPANLLEMNVNLSGRQFSQSDLVEQVMNALHQSKLPPRYLTLEITESVIMENPEATAAMLKRLKALGVQIDIDDFGTGYSSLAYLQRFPVDTMKIDRSFVARIGQNSESDEIIRTIIELAHNLNMKVTAEGIETPEQLRQLSSLSCENVQGYLIGRPTDCAAATELLRESVAAQAGRCA